MTTTTTTKPETTIATLLQAARENLAKYEAMGDERAIRVGRKMVARLERDDRAVKIARLLERCRCGHGRSLHGFTPVSVCCEAPGCLCGHFLAVAS